jgi:hypothetical protein
LLGIYALCFFILSLYGQGTQTMDHFKRAGDVYEGMSVILYFLCSKAASLRRGFAIPSEGFAIAINQSIFMNRYDKTAPSSSELIDSPHMGIASDGQSGHLTKVRSGLTAHPQTMLSDFRLYPTSYGLEIRLPLKRIRGNLIESATKVDFVDETQLGWLVLVVLFFVGGSVALTGSVVMGVIVAGVLPGLLWLAAPLVQAESGYGSLQEGGREATLRLVNAPNGQTLLSLSSAASNGSKRVIYFSHLSVRLVSATMTFTGGRVSFTVYSETPRKGTQLHIRGSRQEVGWLHARIARWGRGRLSKGSKANDTSA